MDCTALEAPTEAETGTGTGCRGLTMCGISAAAQRMRDGAASADGMLAQGGMGDRGGKWHRGWV